MRVLIISALLISSAFSQSDSFVNIQKNNKKYKKSYKTIYKDGQRYRVRVGDSVSGGFVKNPAHSNKSAKNLGKLSKYHSSGRIDEANSKQYKKARKIYEKSCNKGLMHACAGLGIVEYYEGKRLQKKGRRLLRKACVNGIKFACTHLIPLTHKAAKAVPASSGSGFIPKDYEYKDKAGKVVPRDYNVND